MWNDWVTRWKKTSEAIKLLGGESDGVSIGKPVSEKQVVEIEAKLGYRLPESFRDVVLNFAGSVDFGWQLNDCIELPEEFVGIFGGECIWNINELIEIDEARKDWVRECFPDEEDEYDRIWHNKLAFMHIANGDMIAFDLENYPESTPVVYLSHDGSDSHGYILGQDFKDFINRWTRIGCPGAEDWQMMPFIDTPTGGINPEGENALKWRELIGINM
jgi:hypothetical protein